MLTAVLAIQPKAFVAVTTYDWLVSGVTTTLLMLSPVLQL